LRGQLENNNLKKLLFLRLKGKFMSNLLNYFTFTKHLHFDFLLEFLLEKFSAWRKNGTKFIDSREWKNEN
jgi:hypothetical protein